MTRLQAIRLAGASLALVAATLFIALAAAMISGALHECDEAIRAAVHGNASQSMTALALWLSFLGSTPVWLAIMLASIATFAWLGWRRAMVDLTIVMTGAMVLENVLKVAFARTRPEAFIGTLPATFSFPSGHAIFAACLYGALACLVEARTRDGLFGIAVWAAAIVLAGAIGFSRIYLGVHYPSDVAGGFLVAVFWVGLVTLWRASDAK